MVTRVGQSSRQPQAKRGCAAWMCMGKPPVKSHTEVTSARAPPGKSVVGEKSRKKGRGREATAKKPCGMGGRRFGHTGTAPEKPGIGNNVFGSQPSPLAFLPSTS